MRDGWTESTLGDIAEWFSGGTPKAGKPEFYENGTIPWVVIADMMKTEIFDTASKITKAGLAEIGGRVAPKGSVLISMYATVGRPGFAHIPVATNQAIAWSVPNEKMIQPRFLLLVAQFLESEISSMARGATQRNINRAMLKELRFNLPPLDEQKRIVDVVSSVDAYIDALQQQADTALTARNAVLHELLSAGGDDWTETSLGNISTFVSRRESPEGLGLDTPYIGLEHVEPKATLISTWGNVQSVSSSVTPFEPEDTLFGRLRPYLHKVAFADFPGVCSPEILVLRSSSKCESKFLYLLCSLDSTIKKCIDMSAGTRMPRTSTTDLASIEVQLPPLDEQKRIVEIVSSMDDMIQSTEQAVVDAKNLRSGLLSDLLSGEHEIPKSYDSLLGAA